MLLGRIRVRLPTYEGGEPRFRLVMVRQVGNEVRIETSTANGIVRRDDQIYGQYAPPCFALDNPGDTLAEVVAWMNMAVPNLVVENIEQAPQIDRDIALPTPDPAPTAMIQVDDGMVTVVKAQPVATPTKPRRAGTKQAMGL